MTRDGHSVTCLVLCGGRAQRFGADKLGAGLGDSTVLDTLLDSLPQDWDVVCVGPRRDTSRPVRWTIEDPPGGGPLSGVAAALSETRSEVTVLVAGDMPFAGPTAVTLVEDLTRRTRAGTDAAPAVDAVAAQDEVGHVQPLLLAARTEALRGAVPVPAHDLPLMRILDELRIETTDPESVETLDVDTPPDLVRAQLEARRRLEP